MNSNSTRSLFASLVIAGCFVFPICASAEDTELWHGWTDLLVPCSFDGDTLELHGYISADVPTDIIDTAKHCAGVAIEATTVALLLTEGAGGWETFTATFLACMGDRADDVADSLSLETKTVCSD
jgi:hypothetical protein